MVTIISLPFTLSIMGLVAIAILLDSPGAVIFKQQRVGENGRLFTMYKFRTMVKDAEELRHSVERTDENGNVIHKIQNDPRLTRTGKFLRKTSLDELPQLFNVLKGDMSLIGPRPELPYLVKQYQAWQRKRFAVPQGITGWWQVNGRSDRPMHLHTEDDLFYIHNYSMWLDLQILLKTVWVALTRKGAF
jgi:lipopolysaccharide/colanic/teichoic acid biosynthesis glycosyltransferase